MRPDSPLPPGPSLRGRDDLLLAIARALGTLAVGGNTGRLVTLWGPGGIGKTSLAVVTAHRMKAVLSSGGGGGGGVLFVPLASATTGIETIRIAAQALGVSAPGSAVATGAESAALVGDALAARGAVLVVLDNVEQIVDETARAVLEWMARAPAAKFLVTSREPLAIAGEHVIAVGPLRLPDAKGSDEEVADSDAAALLLERARALRPDFSASPSVVRRLVRATEGIPLAIELSAAHLDVLGAEALADRLDAGLDMLANPRRDVDERHRTLTAAIDVSLRLLDDEERRVLRSLALVRGGFDAEAAVAVAGGTEKLEVPVLATLRSLVRKAVVRDLGLSFGTPRFALFDSVRAAVLRGPLVDPRAVERHASWVGAAARSARDRSRGPSGAVAIAELVGLQDDLVAVVERFRDAGEGEGEAVAACEALLELSLVRGPIARFVELASRLLAARPDALSIGVVECALASATFLTGQLDAAAEHAESACRRLAGKANADRARAYAVLGDVALRQGDYERSHRAFAEAVALAVKSGDRSTMGRCQQGVGAAHYFVGRFEDAAREYEAALEHLRAAGDMRAEARTLSRKGFLAYDRQQLASARADFDRSLALFEELGDERLAGYARGYIGNVLRAQGKTAEAEPFYRDAIAAMRMTGDRSFESVFLMDVGIARLLADDIVGARRDLEAAYVIVRAATDRHVEGLILGYRVAAEALAGDLDLARSTLAEAERRSLAHASHSVAVHARHIELADAERAGETGRIDAIREWLVEAVSTPPPDEHLRMARRLLATALDRVRPSAEALVIERTRVRPPRGEWLELSAHVSLTRLVEALVTRRLDYPGSPLTMAELLAQGWPGERVAVRAGALRVRVAIAQLRKMGLRGVLLHGPGGYFFDPSVPVVNVRNRR